VTAVCRLVLVHGLTGVRARAGFLAPKDFLAGCAALGVTLNDAEEAYVRSLVATDAAGNIKWEDFINLF
jgi:hypothetical protein